MVSPEGGARNNGVEAWAAEMAAAIAKLPAAMTTVVEKSTSDLVALTQRNASGRPGPNAPTGDYRGSWSVEDVDAGPVAVAKSAGTDRPQALRLEYGYVGTDSLGRTYNQPPYAHHGPAVDVVEPVFHAALELAVRQVFDQ
jgi:hypothetical protein